MFTTKERDFNIGDIKMIEDIFEQGLEDESKIEGLLNNYNKYVSRISTLTSAITNIAKYSCLDGATSNYNPMPGKTGYKDCPMESYVANNDEVTRNFEAKKIVYKNKVKEIDDLIETLNNDRNERIIKAFYFEGLKLQQIADKEEFHLTTIQNAKADSLIKLQETYNQNQNMLNLTKTL